MAHLCNLFSHNLISTIIDNSGYVYPKYLNKENSRIISGYIGQLQIKVEYRYLITNIVFDKEIYDLKKLYSQIENESKVIVFQGIDDELYNYKEKMNFIEEMNNSEVELITQNEVDGITFKSNKHGLNADFIKLFEYVNDKYELEQRNDNWGFKDVEYKTSNYTYKIKNDLGVPILSYEKNK